MDKENQKILYRKNEKNKKLTLMKHNKPTNRNILLYLIMIVLSLNTFAIIYNFIKDNKNQKSKDIIINDLKKEFYKYEKRISTLEQKIEIIKNITENIRIELNDKMKIIKKLM